MAAAGTIAASSQEVEAGMGGSVSPDSVSLVVVAAAAAMDSDEVEVRSGRQQPQQC